MKFLIMLLVIFQFQSYAQLCTKEYRPVCANGKTYSNRCMAKASGQLDIQNGPCTNRDDKIKDQSFKRKSPPKPSTCICPMIWKPVCGVDGKTYGSSCNARCNGVPIKAQGSCEKIKSH